MNEIRAWRINGFLAVFIFIALMAAAVAAFIAFKPVTGVLFVLVASILASGIIVVQPNQALALTFLEGILVLSETAGCGSQYRSVSGKRFPSGCAISTALN